MSNNNGTRWWENYLVRYLVPSIAGIFILMWLNQNIKFGNVGVLENYLPMLKFTAEKFNTASLVGWLLFGTLYCYIASYPVLAIHAMRHRFIKQSKKILNCSLLLIIFVLIAIISGLFEILGYTVNALVYFIASGIFLLLFSYVLINSLCEEFNLYKEHLINLAAQRGKKDEITKEFTESYKHLREHGNTALILLLEILLAIIIFHTLNFEREEKILPFSLVSLVVCIWVAPASFVYFYAHRLEGAVVHGELGAETESEKDKEM